ncbi:MAG: hypothetical protein ACFFG0_43790 [Candidatus Thorarchaeota archaeon]
MFDEKMEGLNLKDRKLITEGVAMSWYFFWGIISAITFGYELVIFFIVAIVALVIGLALGITYFFINDDFFRLRKKIEIYDEKTDKLFKATEKKILNYLKANVGNAYTKRALLNRLDKSVQHPYFKKYIKKNTERILKKMILDGNIQTALKNGETHYFFVSKA